MSIDDNKPCKKLSNAISNYVDGVAVRTDNIAIIDKELTMSLPLGTIFMMSSLPLAGPWMMASAP